MYIDISRKINKDLFVYPGDPEISITQTHSVKNDGYSVHALSFGSHSGTHIDFPRHFYKNGKTAEDYSLDKFCGTAVIIEINEGDTPDKAFFETKLIGKDDIVLLKFNRKPLGITFDAAEYLSGCGIKMIGTEHTDIEDYEDYRVHKFLLIRDILILECIDLSLVNSEFCTLYAFPLNIEDCDAGPVRTVIKTARLNQKRDGQQNM